MDVVLIRHTERETRWGLRFASWALLINFVAILWGAAAAVIVRFILLQTPNAWEFSFYFFLLSLPAQFLSAASAILFLLGFSSMYRHRGESGTIIHGNLRRSFVLLIAFIAAYLAGWAVLFFSAFFFPLFEPGGFQTFQAARAMVSSGISVVVAILLASFLYYVVISYASPNLLSRLKLAVVLFVFGAIATLALFFLAVWTTFPQEFNEVFVAPSALAVFLFWSVYRASQRSPNLVVAGDSGSS